MDQRTYLTTSIAYVNARPHIGHLFEIVSADILARYSRQLGHQVFFLTGTDEHGTKVETAAQSAGIEPQLYVDQVAAQFQALKSKFNLSNDYFVRTTDSAHQRFVQDCWKKLASSDSLVKKTYTGFYCAGCEAFKAPQELSHGRCTIHETVPERIEEENWFFRLSKYSSQVLDWLNASSVISPPSKLNELRQIIGQLDDVSVSRPRSKVSWGIPVPNDESQIIYVWFDALLNYLSALKSARKQLFWPPTIQIIGKDILRFHGIIWPAILLALGYRPAQLPRQLLVHGFINVEGKKMSKSLGNVIDPDQLLQRYQHPDAVRYLLFRQLSFYEDSNFVWGEFDARYNGELANGLGNLVARVIGLLNRLPVKVEQIPRLIKQISDELANQLPSLPLAHQDFANQLELANQLINQADRWTTAQQPWRWSESPPPNFQLREFLPLRNLIIVACYLAPFMPQTTEQIYQQLTCLASQPIFPRLIS